MPSKTWIDDGTRIRIDGDGPTVVLAHGVLMDMGMWERQVAGLAKDHRVVRFDMWGHGGSTDPAGPRTLDDFVGQLAKVVAIAGDRGPPALVGFSMGGLLAQAFAVQQSGALDRLVLMNAVYDRSADQARASAARLADFERSGIAGCAEATVQRWFTEAERETLAREIALIEGWMRAGDEAAKLKAYRVFATAGGSLVGKLDRIGCPTLVLTGEHDVGSTAEMARRMAAEIPGARLEIVPEQRHMMGVVAAAEVNRILRAFLA
ncbi:MAG: alpha/beta fold hydrolase [Alphaproteobacteria bacterium]|jgi:pimeloyl-ACP methyl ester carboxylesterase|nr:alpha/beta fold hydrolase [Alphaproteobacteria bacterium]